MYSRFTLLYMLISFTCTVDNFLYMYSRFYLHTRTEVSDDDTRTEVSDDDTGTEVSDDVPMKEVKESPHALCCFTVQKF